MSSERIEVGRTISARPSKEIRAAEKVNYFDNIRRDLGEVVRIAG